MGRNHSRSSRDVLLLQFRASTWMETSRNEAEHGGYSESGAHDAPLELSDLGLQAAREGMSRKSHSVMTAGILQVPCVLAGPRWHAYSPSVTDESCAPSSHFDSRHHVASWASRRQRTRLFPQPAAETRNGAAHCRSAATTRACCGRHPKLEPINLSCSAAKWREPPGRGREPQCLTLFAGA